MSCNNNWDVSNWLGSIKQRVGDKKYPTLMRIKIGRVLNGIAALPLGTSPLFLVSIPMCITITPSLWAKDKLRHLKQGLQFRW